MLMDGVKNPGDIGQHVLSEIFGYTRTGGTTWLRIEREVVMAGAADRANVALLQWMKISNAR